MIQSSTRSWWLLALCGVFDAMFSLMILFAWSFDGSLALSAYIDSRSTIALMGMLALAAGICALAAGSWNVRRGSSWLLIVNGFACATLGVMVTLGASRPVTFRSIALVVAVMAASLGAYEGMAARKLRARLSEEWLAGVAAAIAIAFAAAFLGFALRWIRLDPSPSAQTFNWLGSYFGFSAICMLALAIRQFMQPGPVHRMAKAF